MDPRLTAIIQWVQRTTDTAAGRGVLVPVSGGSDSALCFWICAQALPPGRAIAAYVGNADFLRCREWFESIGPLHVLPALQDEERATRAWADTRRWADILLHSIKLRCWTAGSRTRTEEVFGTYSLASRLATYLPLAGLWKSEVMELCIPAGVPDEIIQSSSRADPVCERPREMSDVPFAAVDLFLQVKIGERSSADLIQLTSQQLEYLESVYHRNEFKRFLPLRPS